MKPLKTVTEIFKALGGIKSVAAITGANPKAVYHWRSVKQFPADLYVLMTQELARRGHSAPSALWSQKQPDRKKLAAELKQLKVRVAELEAELRR